MPFDPVYPYAGAHAIKSAGFAVEWNTPLSDDELREVQSLHSKLAESLPQSASNAALSIALNQSSVTAPVTSQGIGSIVFARPSSTAALGGVSRALEVSKDHCVGQVNDYTRWADVWAEVSKWFSVVLPKLVDAHAVKAVGLQYTDVFNWRADKKTFDLKKVLREGCVYLPPNVFSAQGLWHSHHGYLSERDTPIKHALLENINVNLLQELGQLSVVITTVHRAALEPVWQWSGVEMALAAVMPDLHERNKVTLRELLNDETLKKINLQGAA
jgi:uncharacterized protein (TIGR04255 family)